MGKIAGTLYGMAVYFTTARHTRNPRGWRESLALFAVAGVGLALLGLVGTRYDNTKIPGLSELIALLPVRLGGLPGAEEGIHPVEIAGSLLWIIPVSVMAGVALMREAGWFTSRRLNPSKRIGQISGWGVLLAVTLVLDVGVLVLTQSRGGYMAIALAGLALVILLLRGWGRWVVVGLTVLGAIAAVMVVGGLGWEETVNEAFVSAPVEGAAFSLKTMSMRVEIWSRAVWAIRDVPLTGLGMNIFRSAVNLLYPTFQVAAGVDMAHAHNELLQAALDLGLPGLVGFLALYVGAVGMLVMSMRAGGAKRLLALGMLGGLLAHFLFGMIDAVSVGAKPGFLFWWLLGMVFGLYDQSRGVRVRSA